MFSLGVSAALLDNRGRKPQLETTDMIDDENEQQSEWPKDILIRQTLDAAAADLDEDYDQESDGGDTLMNEVGESMDSVEIHSWADLDLPPGYEIVDEDERAAHDAYRESKRYG